MKDVLLMTFSTHPNGSAEPEGDGPVNPLYVEAVIRKHFANGWTLQHVSSSHAPSPAGVVNWAMVFVKE